MTADENPQEKVVITDQDGIAIIRINRPGRANAIDPETSALLMDAFIRAEADTSVRAIVVTGTGDAIFCAGADIKAAAEAGSIKRDLSRRNLFETILELGKPTLAALNGSAAGGGFELALACDMRVAVDHASVVLPEAKRGMGAHFATVMLPRMLPSALAYEMLYGGEQVAVTELMRHGLFNRLVPKGEALDVALQLARRIVRNAPLSLARMKQTIVRSAQMPPSAALRLNEGSNPYDSEDRVEGFRAFLEKREPRWSGR